MRLLFLSIILLALFLCSWCGFDRNVIEKERPITGYLLSGEKAKELVGYNSNKGWIEGFWEPTENDIRKVESALIAYLPTVKSATNPKLGTYNQQYAGFITRGRQCIYVIGSAPEIASMEGTVINPKTDVLAMIGYGGNELIYRTLYDLETGSLSGFAFAGPK